MPRHAHHEVLGHPILREVRHAADVAGLHPDLAAEALTARQTHRVFLVPIESSTGGVGVLVAKHDVVVRMGAAAGKSRKRAAS